MKTKILLFVCLFVGVAIFLPACSEDNPLYPGTQKDEFANSLKSKKIPTQFVGVCTPLSVDDGIWYDAADDERVTGLSIWASTGMEPIDAMTTEITGTAEIFVGAETLEDVDNGEYLGKWEMSWKVTSTLTSPDGSTFLNVGHAVGTGTEGEVLGLTAKWKYTMDYDGSPESFMYVSKGKITEPY